MSITALIVFVIFFVFGIVGFVKGFFRKIFTVATLIACIFIAGAVAPHMAEGLKQTVAYNSMNGIYNTVYQEAESKIEEGKNGNLILQFVDLDRTLTTAEVNFAEGNAKTLAGVGNKFIESMSLPSMVKNNISITETDISDALAEEDVSLKSMMAGIIADKVATLGLTIISYLIIGVAVYIVMRIIFAAIKVAERFKTVSMANRFFGLLLGLLEGYFVSWVFMSVLTLFGGTSFGTQALSDISNSGFLSVIYNSNPLWIFQIQ